MAFELQVLLQSVILPATVAMIVATVAWLMEARLSPKASAFIVSIGWWLGLVTGHLSVVRFSWWSDEPWQRLPWFLLIGIVLTAVQSTWMPQLSRALWLIPLGVLTAWQCFPNGEAWKDMWQEQSFWMVLLIPSLLWNDLALTDLFRRDAGRWCGWILIAALAGTFALAMLSYATMGQWILSTLAATVSVLFVSLFRPKLGAESLSPIVLLTIGTMIAWTRFRGSFQPVGIYLCLYFFPVAIALLDRMLAPRSPHWLRIALAASLSAVAVLVAAWPLLTAEEEEW
ncbi:MAG: hypothetical protein U0905_10370 [Pirellulales bacterium]